MNDVGLGRLGLEKIRPHELIWVKYQPFLLSRGYRLRPRYHPHWKPSWPIDSPVDLDNRPEDSLVLNNPKGLIDAIREPDGARVVLKKVDTSSNEIPIALYLSSVKLQLDTRNHTVPILDVLLLPDNDLFAILVMPQLLLFDYLPFRRLGEVTEAFHQFIEGLHFMQEHCVLHGDACTLNLMMEMSKVVPHGVHFVRRGTHDGVTRKLNWKTRSSVSPNKYYFIDFSHSYLVPSNMITPGWKGIYGQDKTVPEFYVPDFYDPFLVEVYQLGNVLKELVEEYDGLEPISELANAMTRNNPSDRPSLHAALEQLDRIPKKLLKRRVWRKSTPSIFRFLMQYCGQETAYRHF